MAINKNHEFEELNGVKCAIVEKNASADRVAFLQPLLNYNGFTVVVVASPPPKAAAAPAATDTAVTNLVEAPKTYTIGVTDVMFNATNAIFGRLLKTPTGHVVTLAYWQQKEIEAHDEIPYYDNK